LPPFSGFIGKVLILHSANRFAEQVWVWPALLTSSLMAMIAFSRAGSTFFWHVSAKDAVLGLKVRSTQIAAIFILLSTTALMSVFADAILAYSQDAVEDLRQDPTMIQRHIETNRSNMHEVQVS
jgi:multicomponent K+:H+ antiporter subunit D